MAGNSFLNKTPLSDDGEKSSPSSLLQHTNLKISPPSMREMQHIEIDCGISGIHDSSGTESTYCQNDRESERDMSSSTTAATITTSKRTKPSKIPLPGKQLTKSPTSVLSLSTASSTSTPKPISRSVCNLSKSMSVNSSSHSSSASNQHRNEINNSCSNISTYVSKSPSSYKYNTSPTLKTRRDSSQNMLRGKNIESLSASSNLKTNIRIPKGNIPTFRNESFQSSNSISRKHSSIHSEDVGKVRNIRSAFWSWLKMS